MPVPEPQTPPDIRLIERPGGSWRLGFIQGPVERNLGAAASYLNAVAMQDAVKAALLLMGIKCILSEKRLPKSV